MSDENIICPFCKDDGFDLVGLKHHLNIGWCEVYNNTLTDEEDDEERKKKTKLIKE